MADPTTRAAFYYDGFNFYHSVLEIGQDHLKWLNLSKLSASLITHSESLVKVVICTAFYPGDEKKKFRHQQFINALQATGVQCVMGHYTHEPKECKNCGYKWSQPNEKASDVNLSLSLISDAQDDVFDTAYLVTADSDQVATAKFFRSRFPKKRIVTVAPPGRNLSAHLQDNTHSSLKINVDFLDYCLFDPIVMDPKGKNHGRRPREYEPPTGWVAPANRKSKAPKARA